MINGWSLGGGVATAAAAALGDRAGGLVLTGGRHRGTPLPTAGTTAAQWRVSPRFSPPLPPIARTPSGRCRRGLREGALR